VDTDDDNDGVSDGTDPSALDPDVCGDADIDGCDDCSVGTDDFGPLPDGDPLNDGLDTDADGTCDAGDLCPVDPFKVDPGLCGCGAADGDTDGDGTEDCLDTDDDNDGVLDGTDPATLDPDVCGDVDIDNCDDCSVGTDDFGPLPDGDPSNDGLDSDVDGICDAGDLCPTDPDKVDPGVCGCGTPETGSTTDADGDGTVDCFDTDDDNDGVLDGSDPSTVDPSVCGDADGDGCDDCSVGTDGFGPLPDNDPANDGTDTDGDGLCDVGDVDDDNDGVLDGSDPSMADPAVCGDTDNDTCDDCSVGTDGFGPLPDNDPANDGTDTDGDGACDAGDLCPNDPNSTDPGPCGCGVVPTDTDADGTADCVDVDDDNDGVEDGSDPSTLDPSVCGDTDADSCDDCSLGNDGFGPLSDSDPANDGIDTDGDGICDGDVPSADITSDTNDTRAVALGDVDGDGNVDMVAGILRQPNRLYLGNGTSNPWSGAVGVEITLDSDQTVGLGVDDMDGDGDLDVVAGNSNQRKRLYLSDGTSTPFDAVNGSDITADADRTQGMAVGDVDGDLDLDVVIGNSSQTNRLYLNNGTADPFNGISGSDITADSQPTRSVALGDVDGDGDLDVVVGNTNRENRLYLNNGTADPFNGVTGSDITGDRRNNRAVGLGDMDGDGDLDVVMGNTGQWNRLYLNNGTADPFNGVTGVNVTTNARNTFAVAVGDADGDGDLDMVTGNRNQPNCLYLNNGTADPFNGATCLEVTSDALDTRAVALADVDGDGDLDLVTGNFGERDRVYLNNGTSDPWNSPGGDNCPNDPNPDQTDTDGDGIGDVCDPTP
jgi:hypothetical protein